MFSKGSGNQWKVLSRNLGSGSDFRKEQLLVAAVWGGGRRGGQEDGTAVQGRDSGAWAVVLAVDGERLLSLMEFGCKWTDGDDGL